MQHAPRTASTYCHCINMERVLAASSWHALHTPPHTHLPTLIVRRVICCRSVCVRVCVHDVRTLVVTKSHSPHQPTNIRTQSMQFIHPATCSFHHFHTFYFFCHIHCERTNDNMARFIRPMQRCCCSFNLIKLRRNINVYSKCRNKKKKEKNTNEKSALQTRHLSNINVV